MTQPNACLNQSVIDWYVHFFWLSSGERDRERTGERQTERVTESDRERDRQTKRERVMREEGREGVCLGSVKLRPVSNRDAEWSWRVLCFLLAESSSSLDNPRSNH